MFCFGSAVELPAQEFRVYSSVTDRMEGDKAKPRTSLTIFHAGKVYDYIESAEETVIFEPAHSRFIVLSRRHDLATVITQDEVRRYLDLAKSHSRELIREWQREGSARREAIAALEFQLLPEFEIEVDADAKSLSLVSPQMRYDVKYESPPSPEILEAYLKAADWTAQLNAVLHPHALLPGPRLRLNDELRSRGVLPVEVELTIKGDPPVHLRAAHEWTWHLQASFDRQFIDDRERELRRPDHKPIPFVEFQRETLTAQRKR
jgi:hypothetical protein